MVSLYFCLSLMIFHFHFFSQRAPVWCWDLRQIFRRILRPRRSASSSAISRSKSWVFSWHNCQLVYEIAIFLVLRCLKDAFTCLFWDSGKGQAVLPTWGRVMLRIWFKWIACFRCSNQAGIVSESAKHDWNIFDQDHSVILVIFVWFPKLQSAVFLWFSDSINWSEWLHI